MACSLRKRFIAHSLRWRLEIKMNGDTAVSWLSRSDQFLFLGGGVLGDSQKPIVMQRTSVAQGAVKAPFWSRPGGVGPNLSAPSPDNDVRLWPVMCLRGESTQ